jgi:hypothetical protein
MYYIKNGQMIKEPFTQHVNTLQKTIRDVNSLSNDVKSMLGSGASPSDSTDSGKLDPTGVVLFGMLIILVCAIIGYMANTNSSVIRNRVNPALAALYGAAAGAIINLILYYVWLQKQM